MYRCSLPVVVAEEGAEAAPASESSPKKPVVDVAALLAPLRANCLYRMESWWTYELCLNTAVKQFHLDAQSGTRLSEYVLGRFDAAQSHLQVDAEQRLVRQTYVGGTMCDLNGQARSVEVRFLCNDKPNGITFVGELQEPSTCKYTLVVVTPLVCELFGQKIANKKAAPTVFCNPVLSEQKHPHQNVGVQREQTHQNVGVQQEQTQKQQQPKE